MTSSIELKISISQQSLEVCDTEGKFLHHYSISSAANGAGELMDSNCTPTGRHIIRAKIGGGEPVNTVFRGRRRLLAWAERALRTRRFWQCCRTGRSWRGCRLGHVQSIRVWGLLRPDRSADLAGDLLD